MQTQSYSDASGFLPRAKELVARMTLEEKAAQMRFDAPAIPRLGIPAYNWWNEGLHGVARAGTATVFPQAIGMAAMFDAPLLEEVGTIVSTEARAKYNASIRHGDRDIYKGLTLWSPNVNLFRDPRWGRGHETYGEDPFLSAALGVRFIRGLQGTGKYLRAAACAKHFAVHSGPEELRHSFDAQVSPKELWETYLPAFEACVREGRVESVMGAYNRTNGEPCCANVPLMQSILREEWGFGGHYVSDCGAIRDFFGGHRICAGAAEASALAVKTGCDLNCGSAYHALLQALADGLLTESDLDRSVERLMATRLRLGMFSDDCEYDRIPFSVIACAQHREKALRAAEESLVLLKNDGILPLPRSVEKLAVIGPNADSRIALLGNYHGTPARYHTILEGICDAVGETTRVYYAEGCHLIRDRAEDLSLPHDRIAEAVAAAEEAGLAIVCLGLDETLEGEESEHGKGGDKASLAFPESQRTLLHAVAQTGVPIILINLTGSAMLLDWAAARENVRAVVQAWYPGAEGGTAVARVLFGDCCPSGRLPVTFYSEAYTLPDFCDYSMKNRTYRYLEGDFALYPFGYGLSYTRFDYSGLRLVHMDEAFSTEVEVMVENCGGCTGDEVVQCYIQDLDSPLAVRNPALCAFARVRLEAGQARAVRLTIPPEALRVVHEDGTRAIDSRRFKLYVGGSQPDARSAALLGQKPLELELTL